MLIARCAVLATALTLAPLAASAEADYPVLADQNGILIEDGYARSAGAMAQSGAAFMRITNRNETDDVLVAALSPAAERVELHTHVVTDGVARMVKLEDGIPVPAGETVLLERGGLHVMFLGLTGPFEDGASIDLTLSFANAGDIQVAVPVDLTRMPMPPRDGSGHQHGHGG